MPTPFYHLRVADELLHHPALPINLRQSISTELPAFYFGHTAPDVQVISGQSRDETHFYSIPLTPGTVEPWKQLLLQYPELADSEQLSNAQRVFIAGYLCHLQADWIWLQDIFLPIFGRRAGWGTFPERMYLHNVLRAYMDFQVLHSINRNLQSTLEQANPKAWLPFVLDEHLQTWRDFLAEQLKPGAPIQTVEVFAARQGISSEKYYLMLESEAEMEKQVFTHLSREQLQRYHEELLTQGIQLLTTYLGDF